MKSLAKAAGYTSASLGELLGVEDGTVRGWWRGLNEPGVDMLNAYALRVGVSLGYLVNGTDPMGEALLTWARAVDAGSDGAQAYESLAVDPGRLTAEQKHGIARLAPEMLKWVRRKAGADWASRSDEELIAVLMDVLVQAQRSQRS